jgi:hypothetical protein
VTDTYVLLMAGLGAGLIGPIVSALLISRHAGLNLWLLGVTAPKAKAQGRDSAGLRQPEFAVLRVTPSDGSNFHAL